MQSAINGSGSFRWQVKGFIRRNQGVNLVTPPGSDLDFCHKAREKVKDENQGLTPFAESRSGLYSPSPWGLTKDLVNPPVLAGVPAMRAR